jgi:hypothetical protein
MANEQNELLWLRRLRMFFLDPGFTIKMIWIGIVTKIIKHKQNNIQHWINYIVKLMDKEKLTPVSKPVLEITEASMFMCITINPKNMLELHGIVAHDEKDLVHQVQEIGTKTRVMYVGNIVDIKHAIIADYERKEQEEFIKRKMEKAKWN